MKNLLTVITGMALMTFSAPAYVHHSGAMFDATKEQSLTGIVREFIWANPHCSFKLEVTDAAGNTEIWAIEMNGPQNLMHEGWKRSSLKSGDKITAIVHPLRDGKPGGLYMSVTLADGTVLKGSGSGQSSYDTPAKTP